MTDFAKYTVGMFFVGQAITGLYLIVYGSHVGLKAVGAVLLVAGVYLGYRVFTHKVPPRWRPRSRSGPRSRSRSQSRSQPKVFRPGELNCPKCNSLQTDRVPEVQPDGTEVYRYQCFNCDCIWD